MVMIVQYDDVNDDNDDVDSDEGEGDYHAC